MKNLNGERVWKKKHEKEREGEEEEEETGMAYISWQLVQVGMVNH